VAKLGPEGTATVHAAKYLAVGEDSERRAVERELEQILDLVHPGWRNVVVQRRFMPRLTVTHHLPTAAAGGTAGRQPVEVEGISNLFLAGDWIGAEFMLADAAMASAKRAGRLAAAARRLSAAA
jgi:hypothetical protein